MAIKKITVFSDFDGTISKKDIGDEIFKAFGDFEPHNSKLLKGEISIYQYWNIVCKSLKPGLTEQEIIDFALRIETDSYFKMFAEYCRENDIPISVVSDGFLTYIRPVIDSMQLEWLTVYCNFLEFSSESCPKPIFPRASESCKCLCASCKRNTILMNTPSDSIIAYIGDGYSDFCGVEHSDIVFAKDALAAHCNKNRIPHFTYSSFFDVYRILSNMKKSNNFRVRHQAMLKRKEAFEIE